jgi:ABC-type multidrug transport system fused ATPase/permease subunit
LRRWLAVVRLYARFLPYAKPDRHYFWLDLVTIVIAVLTNTAMIWLMGMPLSLIQTGDYAGLWTVLAMFAGVLLVNQGAQLSGGWLTQWLMLRFMGRVRNAALSRLLAVSFPVAGQLPRGDLLARLSNDMERLGLVMVAARLYLVSHVLTACLYITLLFWIDTRMALIALATTPVFLLHQRYFSPRKRRATEGFLKANGQLLAFEEQSLGNMRGISSTTSESLVAGLHQGVFARAREWGVRERGLEVAFGVTFTVLIYSVGLMIVWLGVDGIRNGEFPVGALVSFLLYLGYLTVPVRGLTDIGFQVMGSASAAERVLEVLDAAPLVVERPQAPVLRVPRGCIEVQDLAFAYPQNAPLFQRMSLTIDGGETVALVGPSGSGKSTFAALLLRFYDPQRGRILIDGQDLKEVSIHSLRNQLAVVWQDAFLLNDTVRANLRLARPEATDVELEAACRRAHAWEFIAQLPAGLDTRLGAGGTELSGGQRQRLAIAQAFLRDAPILILDEASSALDSGSEQAIVQALNELRSGRTTLMIAHRFSSIRSANRVIYFERDGTVSIGRHAELFEGHAGYREAVEWQTREGGESG